MLQATVCSEIELEGIHQPFLRLLKRKLGIVQTAPNSLLVHGGVFRVKLLANVLAARQTTSLLKRSNGCNNLENLIELRITQGALDAGLTQDPRAVAFKPSRLKIWKNNIICSTIEKCKMYDLYFQMQVNKKFCSDDMVAIRDILENGDAKRVLKGHQDLEIFYLNQLITYEGTSLITW